MLQAVSAVAGRNKHAGPANAAFANPSLPHRHYQTSCTRILMLRISRPIWVTSVSAVVAGALISSPAHATVGDPATDAKLDFTARLTIGTDYRSCSGALAEHAVGAHRSELLRGRPESCRHRRCRKAQAGHPGHRRPGRLQHRQRLCT